MAYLRTFNDQSRCSMNTFTSATIGNVRMEKVNELMHSDKAGCPTMSAAICRVLSQEFGVVYGCFGGTSVMPIAEYRPIS